MKKPIILTTPEFAIHGKELAIQIDGDFGNEKMRFTTFADGTPDINIADLVTTIRDRAIHWLGDFSGTQSIFNQYSALCAIARYGARSLNIICPYFPCGTMERIVTEGDVVTAKAMMRLLGSLPSCRTSKNELEIFDIHDPREQFYADDNIFLKMHSWMAERAKELPEDAVIVFPDLWAKKRFWNLFWKREKIIFEKIRNPNNPTAEEKELKIIEGFEHVKNRKLFIVDDLVMTGGTLKWSARILRDKWATQVSALFTHPVFPTDSFDSFASEFDSITTSDTVPVQAWKMASIEKVTVQSIIPILAAEINS